MNRLLNDEPGRPNALSPISLAFLGDAVYEAMVREHLVQQKDRKTDDLHRAAVRYVSAQAQHEAMQRILPLLTEEETQAFKRGRNTHVTHVPRGATTAQYHSATGFEALFGWLYLNGRIERLRELFRVICTGETEQNEERNG